MNINLSFIGTILFVISLLLIFGSMTIGEYFTLPKSKTEITPCYDNQNNQIIGIPQENE